MWSTTSPAANTPGTLVACDGASTSTYPSSSRLDLAAEEVGARVVADRDEEAGRGERRLLAGLHVRAAVTPVTEVSPSTSTTSESQTKLIFSLVNARSCMILLARSESRRCTIVTDFANRVRNVASSIAESPPPTTAMSWSRKKNPSQVAHQDTPWPESRSSPGTPSLRYAEPVARITARAVNSPSWVGTILVSPVRSTLITSSVTSSAPNRSAWARIWSISSGPMMPSGKPGKFSTSVVFIRAPPY